MRTVIRRLPCSFFAVIVFILVPSAGTGFTPTAKPAPSYPSHLPYSFSNFVWWSDGDLRSLLKKKMSGLGDEIATTSSSLDKMRSALTALLKEKGIQAEVQSEEPGPNAFAAHNRKLFGQPLPDNPPPTIVFSILTPKILIDKVALNGAPSDEMQVLQSEVESSQGKPYTKFSEQFAQFRLTELLNQGGYLEAQVRSDLKPPRPDGNRFLVNLEETVSSGPKYRISSISADGGPLLPGKDLSSYFKSRAGDVAGPFAFGNLGIQLRDLYQHNGYADAWAQNSPTLDREHATVAYQLTVVSGPLYHLRNLKVTSLDASREAKVRELFGLKPGDLWDEQAVHVLYRKIANEPTLKGYSFGFAPNRNEDAGAIDLTLNFYKEGGEAAVTTN
jgi:hypothetical protein